MHMQPKPGPLRSAAMESEQPLLTRRRRRLDLAAQGGKLLEELPRVGQRGSAINDAPLHIGRLLLFDEVHQVLVLDVVASADHEHHGVLEWSTIFGQDLATFEQLWIQIKVVIRLRIAAALHHLLGDLGHRKILQTI